MGWVAIVLALVQLTPDILKLILQVEQVFGAGQGAMKKSVIMNTVTQASTDPKFTSHVSTLIDKHVAILNAAGVFAKSAPAPAAAPPA